MILFEFCVIRVGVIIHTSISVNFEHPVDRSMINFDTMLFPHLRIRFAKICGEMVVFRVQYDEHTIVLSTCDTFIHNTTAHKKK